MKKKYVFPLLLGFLIASVFFHKLFLKGYIPFPGDLLISSYAPFNSFSYLGYGAGGYPQKFQYFDTARQIYPWKIRAIEIFKTGNFPLWNPYNFSGSPLLANNQSSVFYPLNLLFFLSPVYGWALYIFLQSPLAFIFTYLYARKIGLSIASSIFSSIAFAFCLFFSVFSEYGIVGHTILWLPLMLLAVEFFYEKKFTKALLIFSAASFFSVLAGHIQIYGFTLLFTIAYAFFRLKKKTLALFIPAAFISLGLAALQLIPTFELIQNAARVDQEYVYLLHNLLIQPRELILFLSPDFFGNPATNNYLLSDSYPGNALYIGLIPFLFAISTLGFIKKNYFIKFFAIASGVLLLFIVRSPVSEVFYRLHIPFFSTGSPNNAIFLLSFSLSVLAGYGVDGFFQNKKALFKTLIAFALIVAGVWGFLFITHAGFNRTQYILSTVLLIVFLCLTFTYKFIPKKVWVSILVILTVVELSYYFLKFNPFVPKELVYPQNEVMTFLKKQGTGRFWGYGSGFIEANLATHYGIFDPDGYDPLYPKWYGEFTYSSKEGNILTKFSNQTRSDATVEKGYGESDFSTNHYRQKVLNLLGVEYIIDKDAMIKNPDELHLKKAAQEGPFLLYNNMNALPRVFVSNTIQTYTSAKEFEKYFFDSAFDPKTILVEDSIPVEKGSLVSTAKIASYTPNTVEIMVETNRNALVFLSDTFYPGWKARIDGKQTEIYKANYAFRAVSVPRGKHVITYSYEPRSFYLGVSISFVSALCLIGYVCYFKKR